MCWWLCEGLARRRLHLVYGSALTQHLFFLSHQYPSKSQGFQATSSDVLFPNNAHVLHMLSGTSTP